MRRCFALLCLTPLLSAAVLDILPTPRYVEPLHRHVQIRGSVRVFAPDPNLSMARTMLGQSSPTVSFAQAKNTTDAHIVLWNYAASPPAVKLNYLERRTVGSDPVHEQGYVITMDGDTMWVIGGSPLGVQYGAATVAQLLHSEPNGARLEAASIRDTPDFEYRAASDWLLAVELNRWSFDRGKGFEDFAATMRAKLDRAARYKINMALVDGFGWSLQTRPPEYPGVMRELNRYARERGIRLLYGGYGAAYDLASRPGEYEGTPHLNRESYPAGHVYSCLNYPGKKPEASTLGTCRSNDALNRVKGDELARFVDAVEPGAVYIHHEDCCVFEDFQKAWMGRCDRCRKRWPNNSLMAPDGGAGALAHGYSSLVKAINKVKHEGFDASRDTEIILVSPVYMPANSASSSWSEVLQLWRTITQLLTPSANVQIAFREILPQPGGGRRWMELFGEMMREEKRSFPAFVFFVGGADGFLSNYPMSGAPAMTSHFRGAKSIYHATGDFYTEPMELVAAEYGWNMHSNGLYRNPSRESDVEEIARWLHTPGEPVEMFGEGSLFARICTRLYGESAGREMFRYYHLREWLPDVPEQPSAKPNPKPVYYRRRDPPYLGRVFNYVTALPTHWEYYAHEASTWARPPASAEDREMHRRRARLWKLTLQLSDRGRELVQSARGKDPLPEAVSDLEFLLTLFEVHRPMVQALKAFHTAMENTNAPVAKELLAQAARNARLAARLGREKFPHPVDPAMGEVRAILTRPDELAAAIESLNKSLWASSLPQ